MPRVLSSPPAPGSPVTDVQDRHSRRDRAAGTRDPGASARPPPPGRWRIRAAGRCATCASRSPTAATSAAPTACRERSSTRTTSSCRTRRSSASRRSRALAGVFVGLGVKKIRLTGGEPLLRTRLERPGRDAGAAAGVDLTLTTNGSALVQARRARSRTRACDRITVSLDSLDDATFRAMNDADFPVEKVLDGIAAAADAGLRARQDQHGGQARRERPPDRRRWRATCAAPGHILRFIEFMDVGSTNGWRMDDVIPSRRGRAPHRRGLPAASRPSRTTPARSPNAGATGRRRRDRRHLLGDAGLLRRLQPRAPLDRRLALHLPVRPAGPRPEVAAARRRATTRRRATRSPRSGARARTATPRSAPRRRRARPKSRCPTSAADLPPPPVPLLTNAARPATFEVEAINERGEMVPTSIAGEHPLTLYLDKRELVTLMTLGHAPEALAIGFLRNQRLVARDRGHRSGAGRLGNRAGRRDDARRLDGHRREHRASAPSPPAAARARSTAT